MVSLMRIDDRLIHGQVAYGWATSLGINVILVANDEAKNDQMKAMSLNLAKPSNVTLYIRGVEESGEIVEKFASSKKSNVLVLVKNTKDALVVADDDINNFKQIGDLGIDIEFRMLPRDKKKQLSDLIK